MRRLLDYLRREIGLLIKITNYVTKSIKYTRKGKKKKKKGKFERLTRSNVAQ